MNEAAAPRRVAIADDHAVVCEGYRRLLELEDDMRVVATFSTGEAAYQWLITHDADVLVLDISMPGRGGLDTLRRLHYRLPALRIMVFTMHEGESIVAQALQLGALRVVTKTSAPRVLINAVRAVAALPVGLVNPPDSSKKEMAAAPHVLLSPREFDVFLMLAEGYSVDEIADNCTLSRKTIANYQTNIRQKTGCRGSIDIHRYALYFQLIAPDVPAPQPIDL
jgi:DNA-binding NarL/FixJ family response regulator